MKDSLHAMQNQYLDSISKKCHLFYYCKLVWKFFFQIYSVAKLFLFIYQSYMISERKTVHVSTGRPLSFRVQVSHHYKSFIDILYRIRLPVLNFRSQITDSSTPVLVWWISGKWTWCSQERDPVLTQVQISYYILIFLQGFKILDLVLIRI